MARSRTRVTLLFVTLWIAAQMSSGMAQLLLVHGSHSVSFRQAAGGSDIVLHHHDALNDLGLSDGLEHDDHTIRQLSMYGSTGSRRDVADSWRLVKVGRAPVATTMVDHQLVRFRSSRRSLQVRPPPPSRETVVLLV